MSAPAPYSAGTWSSILACGDAVEASFAKTGMLFTMGGEPTFIPHDPQGPEWNTAALGPTKLDYARRFARQLIETAYPGAMILETSGKHYPGEPLPRWALLVQWRADGQPLWKDITRLRGDTKEGRHTNKHAADIINRLAKKLSVSTAGILPSHDTANPDANAGYVLPLDHDGSTWITDDWTSVLKQDSAALFPGDSLIGLRLPLASLGEKNLRRALTVEVKSGALTIFIPPLSLEAYLELISAIESVFTAAKLKDAVLAGYAPPLDPRLPTIGFASDPGVIEINLAICENWAAYDRQLDHVYTAATAIGMTARKLQLNGRETGTGGGAHLVFGGPLGFASPFFAFPALLPSAIRYFQHHPGLSYAFTGQYMGPSSQAPRIDESTFEALYELEIACAGAEQFGSPHNFALFDLLFRDLLMDRSGNTHRAEISVDKLWNPFAGNGRAGLVELRAFETHPDRPAMSVVALFIRAIFARLAADPYKAPFIRWNGELHDKFFLPAFVWQDLSAICADLREHGIPFETEWLRPLWEFRFPKLGEFTFTAPAPAKSKKKPVTHTITFRQALEAWPLLGEQPNGGGGTSRCVDASMDRIEVSVSDVAILETGFLLVNGLPCELRPLEGTPSAAGGVRYRAFFLNPALHPHIPVHAPLLIEWIDKSTFAVTAAARWHVWNPRSVPYTSRPAKPADAIERFTERWETWPHTLGQPRLIQKVDFPPEGRHTLDLRRYSAQAR
ncbi:transglutaminase family protein [Rariglobus hedericola]|uniref:Transglutaminase n=1 Tax=Rariglobus hedericola TaxID=2597822 RepID=A0A556QEP3_9BACT|nr:transglutaminase family protein [Rariglobus hedericola]TSJ75120.1 transglutaminase [Rariglobus hedericola]